MSTIVCTHTHTLTHSHIYTHTPTHTLTYTHTHTHTHTPTHTSTHIHLHTHTHTHTHTKDINECAIPGTCSQLCHNMNGSHDCSCVEGYVERFQEPGRCKAVGKSSIVLSNWELCLLLNLKQIALFSLVCQLECIGRLESLLGTFITDKLHGNMHW